MKNLLILLITVLMASCEPSEYRIKTAEGPITAYNAFSINGLTIGDSVYIYSSKGRYVYNTWVIAREFGPDTSYKVDDIQLKFLRGRIVKAL